MFKKTEKEIVLHLLVNEHARLNDMQWNNSMNCDQRDKLTARQKVVDAAFARLDLTPAIEEL
ncbi:MAG: hypothetical protein HOE83_23355 [Alphaproteobacteria bacterium]|nr:hypothetical protein [Alphaproteobacteria bacterium]